jgi:hypothetical protein
MGLFAVIIVPLVLPPAAVLLWKMWLEPAFLRRREARRKEKRKRLRRQAREARERERAAAAERAAEQARQLQRAAEADRRQAVEADRARQAAQAARRHADMEAERQLAEERRAFAERVDRLVGEAMALSTRAGWDTVSRLRDGVWDVLSGLDEGSEVGSNLRRALNHLDGLLRVLRDSPWTWFVDSSDYAGGPDSARHPTLPVTHTKDRGPCPVAAGPAAPWVMLQEAASPPAIVQPAVDPFELKIGCWVCQDQVNVTAPRRYLGLLWCEDCHTLVMFLVERNRGIGHAIRFADSITEYKSDLLRYKQLMKLAAHPLDGHLLDLECPFCKGGGLYLGFRCFVCDGSGALLKPDAGTPSRSNIPRPSRWAPLGP